ncbi:uncharacterized protein H6S33_000002 [Morchella sextelata]|uniref:uncharacterized protein n=1 Tax=Morchella sextelata TaxID=1174677 RepID=UPI001D058BDB|nr:uncharacterized protein H6S33_000002 [Morchella sextelata]KAH0614366.1 hypothetical protein H6S33_000002 [Morchella sextelata]
MIIKGTDKNLGPVILSGDWYISEVEKFLTASQNYWKLEVGWVENPGPALLSYNEDHTINGRFKWLANTIHEVRRDLTDIKQCLIDVAIKQEKEYLEWWNLQFDIPRFHSGAANATPWIVQSAKDIAVLLRKAIIPDRQTRRKMFVCIGDVVAIYPNIPADANSIIALKGLAMEAACSPDIVNIYAAYYEQNVNFNVQTFEHDNPIKVYCRYIDDRLAIIEADSAEHCWAILGKHNLGSVLRTEWSVIGEGEGPSPFLDLEIDILSSSTLDFKLYRKSLNYFMHIPWKKKLRLSLVGAHA